MSGDLWQMARNGTTLLPGEARKLALAYDKMRQERDAAEDTAERRWQDIILAAKKIDRLRKDLAQADTASQILREVIEEQRQRLVETKADWAQTIGVADELEQEAKDYKDKWATLACVLDNLRKPSEAVLEAATIHYGDVRDLIRAAVAAAEQETSTQSTND